jgi:hypothetical protein
VYPSIWIRAEYIRTYDFLEDHYRDTTSNPGPAPGAVLTGQPGIGSSKGLLIIRGSCKSFCERQERVDLLCLTSTSR